MFLVLEICDLFDVCCLSFVIYGLLFIILFDICYLYFVI